MTARVPIGDLSYVLDDHIKPNALAIAEIVAAGGIAVVVANLSALSVQFAKALGWDGKAAVFRMSAKGRRVFAAGSKQNADHVTASWLVAKRDGRILYVEHSSTLLINFTPGEGYSLEPGSTDSARAKA